MRQMELSSMQTKWFGWFHFVYASLVIASSFFNIWNVDQTDKELILLSFFSAYFLILLLFLLFFTINYSRKARYSEATKAIHDTVHASRDAYHYLDWCVSSKHPDVVYNEGDFCEKTTRILTSLSTAFTLVTGTKCRSSLKVIGQDENDDLFVTTLARDNTSTEDKNNRYNDANKRHLISANTDFMLIAGHDYNYFFHNNLPKYDDYQNSSIEEYRSPNDSRKWVLPYKSTIVWPIRYKRRNNENNDRDADLYGFLTIDSSSRNVFSDKYDVDMGAIVADSLFATLDAYSKVKTIQANPGD